jgi:hypothetical protein
MAAVRTPTRVAEDAQYELWEWTGVANGDSGSPIFLGNHADLTFHVFGTFNGETVAIRGALNAGLTSTTDPGAALEEESGVPVSLTSTDTWATSRTAPLTAWPVAAGTGDGSTSLTIRAVIRR